MVYANARFLTQRMTGVQRYAMEISRELRKLRKGIRFISPKNVLHRELASELEAEEYGKLTGHFWEQVELPAYLNSRGTPLLVNFAATAPVLYRNQLTTIHDLAFLRNPGWFSKSSSYYYRFLIPLVARRLPRIITVSEFSKGEIVNLLHVPEERIKVIPNGVSSIFTPANGDSNEYGDYILTISALNPRKNLRRLFEAYRILDMGNTKLVVVGEENRVFGGEGLKELIQSSDGIVHHRIVDDQMLLRLYRNARIMVYPSLYEGFGLPPLEAMGCGCPVVVSNATSLPEVCGDAAFYVDPYKVESIAEGMCKVLTDDSLRQSLIRKGLGRAKMFTWEQSAKEHLKVFEEVMAS